MQFMLSALWRTALFTLRSCCFYNKALILITVCRPNATLAGPTLARDLTQSQGEVARIIWSLLSEGGGPSAEETLMSGQQREAKGCDCVWPAGRTDGWPDGRKTSGAGRCEQPALKETAERGRRAFCCPTAPPLSSSSGAAMRFARVRETPLVSLTHERILFL